MFVSTKWNSLRGPIRDKRHPEGEKKLDISANAINLVMRRLGVGDAMELDAENESNDIVFGEDDLSTLFDEDEPSFDEIKETFDVFDSNKDGFIDCGDLRRVLSGMGFRQGCELEDCKRMIRDFDANGDGLIDFREFVMFMERCLSHS
ncbi:vesicle-associated protein 1-4-like [Dorcoceras hygrometricum]|uniref:Vesicle-associated protein 1-4-like n=1 Tax=Dorcoceras hygrometricum TaxID=472368 RepID=A0A2Z7AJ06_9LAMI|nr:vesicle-associated protein 1-4-like [Dorcoceras hygrometricum]